MPVKPPVDPDPRKDAFADGTWLHDQAHRAIGPKLRRWMDSAGRVNDVQLRAAEHSGAFPNQRARRGWLRRVLVNLAATAGRRRGTVEWTTTPAARGESPSRLAESSEEARNVRALVRALPARERRVVRMRVVEGQPFAVIAQRLGITEGHARVVFHRSLERMRGAGSRREALDGT